MREQTKEDRERNQEEEKPKERKATRRKWKTVNDGQIVQTVSLLAEAVVRLTQPEPSPISGWLMKRCEAQAGRHLRHSFLKAAVVWNRRHSSRQTSYTSISEGFPGKNIRQWREYEVIISLRLKHRNQLPSHLQLLEITFYKTHCPVMTLYFQNGLPSETVLLPSRLTHLLWCLTSILDPDYC